MRAAKSATPTLTRREDDAIALVGEPLHAGAGTVGGAQRFGATVALEFETVYIVLSADYNKYMDIQQAINLRIHRELEKLGIEFAMSNRTLLAQQAARDNDAANDPAGANRAGDAPLRARPS